MLKPSATAAVLAKLDTIADRPRCAQQKWQMTSQLQTDKTTDREAKKAEDAFRKEVFRLDKGICRCCLRKVIKTLSRVWNRAEVHHVHGRIGTLRYLVRCALLLCAECHEKVTGIIGHGKLVILPTKTFLLQGVRVTDARKTVAFKEAA